MSNIRKPAHLDFLLYDNYKPFSSKEQISSSRSQLPIFWFLEKQLLEISIHKINAHDFVLD